MNKKANSTLIPLCGASGVFLALHRQIRGHATVAYLLAYIRVLEYWVDPHLKCWWLLQYQCPGKTLCSVIFPRLPKLFKISWLRGCSQKNIQHNLLSPPSLLRTLILLSKVVKVQKDKIDYIVSWYGTQNKVQIIRLRYQASIFYDVLVTLQIWFDKQSLPTCYLVF